MKDLSNVTLEFAITQVLIFAGSCRLSSAPVERVFVPDPAAGHATSCAYQHQTSAISAASYEDRFADLRRKVGEV